MKKIRQKGSSYSDISADDVFATALVVVLIIVVVGAIILGLWALATVDNNKSAAKHNERAAEFNAKSLEDRQTIAEWTESDDIDPESYLMVEKEATEVFLLAEIHGRENVGRVLPIYIGAILMILSLCVFVRYLYEKNCNYYICSLPYDKAYGWILFFCMFVGWPVMLVSFVRMRVEQTEFYREQHKKRQEAREQRRIAEAKEKAEVKRLAEDELAEAARRLTRPAFPERAHRALVAYITTGQPKAYRARLRDAKQRTETAKEQLQKAGETVREAQRKLGNARAELEQMEKTHAEHHGRKAAEAEWEAIKNARGVSKIVYNRRRNRLEVTIKVRVPYEGDLYDFGDYVLYIDGSSTCTCREIRSGVKLTHDNTSPHYHLSGKRFCFGSSLSTIERFLADGRYAEAVTLVVECLHSVNDEWDAKRIPGCFRRVSVVEQTKRNILLGNRIKSWQRRVNRV